MLTFLRKFRKSLIDSGSAQKYLFYAIGEILLVMIGILLALQVNNWNELRKSKNLEEDFLRRFIDDLNKDLVYYKMQIAETDELLTNYLKFIEEVYQPQKSLEEFLRLMKYLDFPPGELTINDATYLEIVNAGQLNLIRDSELKSCITKLYRNFDQRNKHIQEYDGVTGRNLGDLNQELKILKSLVVHRDNLPWKKDYMYENIKWNYIDKPLSQDFLLLEQAVGLYYNKHRMVKRYIEDLDDETAELTELIKEKLN